MQHGIIFPEFYPLKEQEVFALQGLQVIAWTLGEGPDQV